MIYDVEQYSEQWWTLRSGRVTASMVWAVCKKLKRKEGESADRQQYRERILAQTLTGYQGEHEHDWKSKAMKWGTEFEATAKAQYEVKNGCAVGKMGFCTHQVIDRFSASPDGTVGSDGLIQIKCPNTTTHLSYRLADSVPEDYEPQMMAELACTGRQWCDFVSFDPRLPKHLQLFIKRLNRDETRIKDIESEVLAFLAEVDVIIAHLNGEEPTLEAQLKASLEMVRGE